MNHGRGRTPWLSEALVVAVLLLLPLLFWWRLWALDPADRASIPEGDFTSQYYPLQLFAARELAAGHLPAWNPYLNAGQPGLADIQTGAFYPPNLLLNLVLALSGLPFSVGLLTAQVVLHFSLASLFTYLFVRHLACRSGARAPAARFAGAVAALSFTYAGYLTSFPVQQLTILETAVWLPLVLFFLDRAFGNPHWLAQVILASLALACALLAGHPQTAMYVVYIVVAYGLAMPPVAASSSHTPPLPTRPARLTFRVWRFTVDVSRLMFLISRLVPLLLILALTLSAVQLIPTLTFLARSTRSGLDYDAVAWGIPLAEMTHLLYPGYFGGSPQYVGVLPPILAGVALFAKRARRQVVFWLAVALIALVLAFGGHAFLYNLFYLLVPGFSAVRNQERVIYLFGFAVSVLAGHGALILVQPLPRATAGAVRRLGRGLGWAAVVLLALTALYYYGFLQGLQANVQINMFEGVLRHHALLLLILGGAVVLFALRSSGRVRRRGLMALALGLIWLNLFTINWRYNLADPPSSSPFPTTGLVDFLKEQPGVFRISSAGLLPGGASAAAVYRIEDITANTPLRLDSFQRFGDQVGSWRQWQLLNVWYVLDKRDLTAPGLTRVYEEGEVKAYRVEDPLPRAWVVHDAMVAEDEEALLFLNAADFDLRATALLPPGVSVPPLSGEGGPDSTVHIAGSAPGRLELDVMLDADGLLVLSQPFYPGWQARVDGRPVPIYRVDFLLQAVWVGTGKHQVELAYHLPLWPAIASVVGLLACAAGLTFSKRLLTSSDRSV